MEPVPIWILKCRKSYIEVVPIVEVVDLDAKIMAKSRKTEFELMDKPDMLNISCNRASTEKQEECIRF